MSELSEKLFSCYFFSPVLFQLTYREIFLNSWTSLTLATLSKSFLWFFLFFWNIFGPLPENDFSSWKRVPVFVCFESEAAHVKFISILEQKFWAGRDICLFLSHPFSHLSFLASSLTLFLILLSHTASKCLSLCLSLFFLREKVIKAYKMRM